MKNCDCSCKKEFCKKAEKNKSPYPKDKNCWVPPVVNDEKNKAANPSCCAPKSDCCTPKKGAKGPKSCCK